MFKRKCGFYLKLVPVVLLFLSSGLQASDIAREKRWADQIVDAIIDGDAVWLNDGKNKFLGIYTEAEDDAARAVIVMHGTGVHPDWQQVVKPIRVGLTEHGWHTLSIQMPVLASDAAHEDYAPLYDEVAPRIDAAISYLHEKDVKDIELIGHSQGASMAAYYLSKSGRGISGFVAIGLSGNAKDARMDGINSIEKIKVPMLDLYGEEDLESVLKTVKQRAAAAEKAGNKNFSQMKIPGNHFYDDNEEGLVDAVSGWLDRLKGNK